jgi:hypothetical protein
MHLPADIRSEKQRIMRTHSVMVNAIRAARFSLLAENLMDSLLKPLECGDEPLVVGALGV